MSVGQFFILVAQFFLLGLAAFCSGSETALFSLTYNDRLQLRKRSPRAAVAVDRLMAQPRSVLITLLMSNMAVCVVYLALGSVMLLTAKNQTVAAVLNTGAVIALIAVGEVTPKLLAASRRIRLTQLLGPLVLVLHRVLSPLRRVAEGLIIAPLSRLVRPRQPTSGEPASLTVEELSALVRLGAAEGDLARDEQQLLAQVVELGAVPSIRDVMAPRLQIHWLSSSAKPDEVMDLVRKTGVTHIPIYKGSPDKEIVGMLDARRYLGAHVAGRNPRLTDHASTVVYVPDMARLDKLLPQFERSHSEVLLCVDEYGTVDGLVRIGDVVDRLVAKFAEEDAIAGEMHELTEQGVERLSEGKWSVPGRLRVREWSELFGLEIDRRVATVGGLVVSRLGRMARVGDELDFGNVHVRVCALRGNLIERLEVSLRDAEPAQAEEEGAMTTGEIVIASTLLVVGLLGAAFCSGVETGIYSLSRIRLSLRSSQKGDVLARLLQRETERPARVLATLLIANTLFSDLGSLGISALLEPHFTPVQVVVLNVVILTPLLLIFSESVPKEVFRVEADRLTYYAAPLLTGARWLLTVTLLLPLIEWMVRIIGRRLGLEDETSLVSPEQRIAALLKEGARHGVLSESQTTLLDRALLLRDTRIRGEMVPWSQAHVVSATWDRARLAEFLATHHQSRYPVVDNAGAVIGVVEHLDLCVHADRAPVEFIEPVVFLDPEQSVRDGLVLLKAAGARLGVVRQGGKPVGVVSTADLIEPLLGGEAGGGRRLMIDEPNNRQ